MFQVGIVRISGLFGYPALRISKAGHMPVIRTTGYLVYAPAPRLHSNVLTLFIEYTNDILQDYVKSKNGTDIRLSGIWLDI